jgi:hypothetical protein
VSISKLSLSISGDGAGGDALAALANHGREIIEGYKWWLADAEAGQDTKLSLL